MENVTLTGEGTLLKKGIPVSGSPLRVLSHLIELEQGVTLASFFAMLNKYEILIQLSDMLEPLR